MCELSLHVLDIAQNSVSAGADTIKITIKEIKKNNLLEISIEDNGCGMDKEMLEAVKDPFFTTRKTRKVGLGIPLFKMAAESAGGKFEIDSRVGVGTKVYASFELDNIDRAPIGDMESTIITLLAGRDDLDIVFTHCFNGKSYSMDTREFRAVLGESIRLDFPEVTKFISSYLKENEKEIYGGAN